MKQLLQVFILIILLPSCSTWQESHVVKMRATFSEKKYDDSLKILESNTALKKPQNQLLYHLEKGTIFFEQENHELSSSSFQKAKEILESLYTKSVSKGALSLITNDHTDVYYGENYEKSLLHLYQTMNFFSLYAGNMKNKSLLMKARAEIISWNTLLENLQYSDRNQDIFKNDLMAKLFGAIVHEEVATASDRQISLQLYKDAYTLAEKSYANYKSYTLDDSIHMKILKDYIRTQILRLTQIVRPYEVDKMKKLFAINDLQNTSRKNNFTIILKKNLVARKTPKKQHFSLHHAINNQDSSAGTKIFAGVSSFVLTSFAADQLGLLPPPHTWTPLRGYLGYDIARSMVEGISIDFELPVLEAVYEDFYPHIVLRTQDGKEVMRHPLILSVPVDDMAEESVLAKSSRLYARTGMRLALKHLTAIAASYATYSLAKGKDGNNEFLARNMAVLQYMAASKAIANSEKADIRQWSTLAKSFWLLDTFVPKGNYRLFISSKKQDSREQYIADVSLNQEDSRHFLSLSL